MGLGMSKYLPTICYRISNDPMNKLLKFSEIK